jgi:hypothetical protein
MNKAFVREPDDDGKGRCPACGSLGDPVGEATLSAWLCDEGRRVIAPSAWFCPFARCEVAYFDAFERSVPIASLKRPAWPKDATAPLCACFGLTWEDIEADVREGTAARTRAALDRARSSEARCLTSAPNGKPCIAEVQRTFMKLKTGG